MTPAICDPVIPQLLTRKWEGSGLWALPYELLAKGKFQFYCYLWVSKSSKAHMCILFKLGSQRIRLHCDSRWHSFDHLAARSFTSAYSLTHIRTPLENEQLDEQMNPTIKQKMKCSTNPKWGSFQWKKNHYKPNYSCSQYWSAVILKALEAQRGYSRNTID